MSKTVKLILGIVLIPIALFDVLFAIYFFNLDMKFMSKFVEPILLRHYDKIPRKQYI